MFFNNCSQYAETYSWNFGDGITTTQAEPSHTYTEAGTYTVKLTSFGAGLQNEITYDVIIEAIAPVPNFSIIGQYINESTKFYNYSQYAENYKWDFGDGATSTQEEPSHTYITEGIYTIKLTCYGAGFEEEISHTKEFSLRPPTACFTVMEAPYYINEPIKFINCSEYTTSCEWDFGDGITSTSMDNIVYHSYNTIGDFDVKLTSYGNGLEDEDTETLNIIFRTPIACLSTNNDTYLKQTYIYFTNCSQYSNSYEWNFDDGSSIVTSETPPAHSYYNVGIYNVNLKATGDGEQTDETDKQIRIINEPKACFTKDEDIYLVNEYVYFKNCSDYENYYQWDFGDNGSSISESPSHSYSSAGYFTVNLTVSAYGYDDSYSENIEIINGPIACFNTDYDVYLVNDDIQFQNCSEYEDDYEWNFGDGASSISESPSHSYSFTGDFDVNLTVSASGYENSCPPKNIKIINEPVACFNTDYDVYLVNDYVHFQNCSEYEDDYKWDFGDGGEGSISESPSHRYSLAGDFEVNLTVSASGYENSFPPKNIKIINSPIACFETDYDTYFVGENIVFFNCSENEDSYQWDFGDGTILYSEEQEHVYNEVGTYEVTLIVYSQGFQNTIIKYINVVEE